MHNSLFHFPALMLVTNRKLCKTKSLEKIVTGACKSGVNIIQLREKDLHTRQLLNLALKLRLITKKYSSLLLINDRLDIALLSKADGTHLPANGIPFECVKKFFNGLSGKSVHNISEALKAEEDGYDYIIFGPVFRTQSKIKYGKPQGLKKLKGVCDRIKIPVFAIGGVTSERAAKCIKAGASGIAVMSAILKSRDIKKTVTSFIFSSPLGRKGGAL